MPLHNHHRDQWTIKRLTQIVDHAIGELDADSGLIRGFDPKTRTLKLIATGSSRIHLDATASVKVGEGISGYVALKKKNVVIGNVDGHPHLGSREFIRKHGIKSVIGAPIFVGRKLYGTFTFHSTKKNHFSSKHFKRLKDDILFASVFLHYLSLLETASREANHFKALDEMNRAVAAELTTERLYKEIFNHIKKIVEPQNFRIDLYTEEEDKARMVFCIENGKPKNIDFHPVIDLKGSKVARKIITERKPVRFSNLNRSLTGYGRKVPLDMMVASFVGLPMIVRNRCIGYIMCWDRVRKDVFDKQTVKLLSLAAAQAAVTINNAQLFEQLNKSISDLTLLYQIEYVISSILNLEPLLKTIVDLIGRAFDGVITAILLSDEKEENLTIGAISKGVEIQPRYAVVPFHQGIIGEAISSKRAVYAPCVTDNASYVEAIPGVICELAIPLMVGTKTLGVIDFESRTEHCFNRQALDLLDDVAHRISVALENALLYEKLEKNYAATVRALVLAVEAKDAYTRGHSERVTRLAVKLAEGLKLSEPTVRRLYWAGLLHDIGKIGVSEKVLNKPKTLNDFEFEEIKRHPIEGARMLEEIEQMKDIIPIIRHHHENYDGTGYPDKLKGSDIPIEARILAVCDMYDAFTSARPYRRPYVKVKALDRLISFKGTRLDPKIVETFMALFSDSSL
ncbi:MAG TPA: HD domain-containing phosphohydrolase [bacterium]